MRHILIKPTTFDIHPYQINQNPYIIPSHQVMKRAMKEHSELVSKVAGADVYTVAKADHANQVDIPDIVFVANGGFSLRGLPEPIVVLPQMKYKQRKDELPFLMEIFADQGLNMVEFPSDEPFEGQAEAKWFHGTDLLICGYGHRSTKKSFDVLDSLLKKIYKLYGKKSPKILALPLESADYYHLDVAMLEFGDDSCIVHKRAFSPASIKKLEKALGKRKVHVIDTDDNFCLNAVVQGRTLFTHVVSKEVKDYLEKITGLKIVQTNTDVFEKSGGSVRCMIMDIHPLIQ